MPALIDIRRRIRSVKNTQQITKAMKMVSAAKLRRAQEAMFAARPYARKMMEVLNSLAARAKPDVAPAAAGARRRPRAAGGGHRGQGAVRRLQRQHHPHRRALPRASARARSCALGPGGPQGPRLLPAPRATRSAPSTSGVFQALRFATAQEIAQELIEALHARARWTRSTSLYNEFKSVIQQRIVVERLLPIQQHGASSRSEPAHRLHLRAGARRHLRRASCRATSRSRSGARCSSRRRPSTARAWRPWTRPPTTPAR